MANTKKADTKKDTIEEVIKDTQTAPEKKLVAKDIDLNQYITVKNGFQGKLIYISPKTGETFQWDSFGDEQEIELRELKNAKSSAKAFFKNNWFMFDEDWVIDFLGVREFYKHAISIEDFDDIFKKSPNELRNILKDMSDGQKRSLAYRARVLIKDGEIDSLKVVSTIEDVLGIELIEK